MWDSCSVSVYALKYCMLKDCILSEFSLCGSTSVDHNSMRLENQKILAYNNEIFDVVPEYMLP